MNIPAFIVSAPRSGSTFLRAALDAHPEITMTNEAGWVALLRKAELLARTPSMAPIDDGEGFRTVGVVPGPYLRHTTHAFIRSVRTFFDSFRESVGAAGRYFGDKVHSHADAACLLRWFSDVRVIWLVRDPRDVLVSSYTFQQKGVTAWQEASFEVRCDHLARFFAEMEVLLHDRDHVVVRYEDLVADPAGVLRKVLGFLSLEWADQLDHWLDDEARRLFERHGTSRSPQESIGRWRTMLDDAQRARANEVLGPRLRALRYE